MGTFKNDINRILALSEEDVQLQNQQTPKAPEQTQPAQKTVAPQQPQQPAQKPGNKNLIVQNIYVDLVAAQNEYRIFKKRFPSALAILLPMMGKNLYSKNVETFLDTKLGTVIRQFESERGVSPKALVQLKADFEAYKQVTAPKQEPVAEDYNSNYDYFNY
jgi:hypothetical protein